MPSLLSILTFLSLAVAAQLVAQPAYYQRSTLLEHPGHDPRFTYSVESPDGSVFAFLWVDTAQYVVKLDPNGDPLWSMRYMADPQDGYSHISELAPTADGGALLVHDLDETTDGLEYWQHAVCTRIDGAGQVVWSKRYSTTIQVWSSGGWNAEVVNHPNGEHTILLMEWPAPYEAPVLMRISASGDLLWSVKQALGSSGGLDRFLLPADGNSTILVTPSDAQSHGVFRHDQNGALVWGIGVRMTNAVWTSYNTIPLATASGQVYLAGDQHGLNSVSYPFLLRIAASGVVDWYKLYGTGQFGSALPMYGPARQLASGDLLFGSLRRSYFDANGEHLGSAVQSLPTEVFMNNEYQLIPHPSKNAPQAGSLVSGAYHKTDLTFAYQWSTPTIVRIPWNLGTDCGWATDTILTQVDTIVPAAIVSVDNMPLPQSQVMVVTDTTTIALPANLTTFFDFCTLVGFEENTAHYHPELEVFPSPLAAGDPLHLRTSKAAEIIVVDARGRIVWRGRVPAGLTQIPTSGLASGLHLVQGIDGQGKALGSARFVVE